MNEVIIVSPALPEDAYGIQEVRYTAWLETYPNAEFGVTVEDIEDRFKDRYSEGALAELVKRIVNPEQDETTLVAKDGSKVVGVCRIVRKRDSNELQSFYVLPEYQRKGIGKKLWSHSKGCFNASLPVHAQIATYNSKAIRFYSQIGFVATGNFWQEEKLRMNSGAIITVCEMVYSGL